LRVAIGDLGAVRDGRVASLRGRIERGEYAVPPELVARAFLRAMLADLLA
jgi:anti-sigma28 factor (negative regulator of flagellin synthesis)